MQHLSHLTHLTVCQQANDEWTPFKRYNFNLSGEFGFFLPLSMNFSNFNLSKPLIDGEVYSLLVKKLLLRSFVQIFPNHWSLIKYIINNNDQWIFELEFHSFGFTQFEWKMAQNLNFLTKISTIWFGGLLTFRVHHFFDTSILKMQRSDRNFRFRKKNIPNQLLAKGHSCNISKIFSWWHLHTYGSSMWYIIACSLLERSNYWHGRDCSK